MRMQIRVHMIGVFLLACLSATTCSAAEKSLAMEPLVRVVVFGFGHLHVHLEATPE